MKKHKTIVLAIAMSTASAGFAQDWNRLPGGNVISSTEYLGAAAGSIVPLRLKTVANYPIDFYTADRFRARINPNVTYPSLNNFTNIPADGFTLITPTDHFLSFNPRGPFSRLHLAEGEGDNAQAFGYRPWQRNGVTFTGNADQGYIGHKYRDEDETDMVIQWSDNPGFSKGDRMRFIFTSQYHPGTPIGMNSEEGLEGMRLWPKNDKEINVGVGDFYAFGGDPTERLHVRDGRVRIQQLPDDPEASQPYKVMVVDDSPGIERGVVKWANISGMNCSSGWWLQGNNAVTAFNGNPCPPQDIDRVGIGMQYPASKLHVAANSVGLGGTYTAARVDNFIPSFDDNGTDYVGLEVFTVDLILPPNPNSTFHYGGRFTASNATKANVGVEGISRVTNGFSTPSNIGVRGVADPAPGGWGVGVAGISYDGVAGQFDAIGSANGLVVNGSTMLNGTCFITGAGWVNGGTPIISDENFKHQIVDLDSASALIRQLHPKRYLYNTAEYAYLGLPDGERMGLLAQDVEGVLPEVVYSSTVPEVRDTAGTLIHPALPVTGIDYSALIPLLIASNKEMQATIAQLQDQFNDCCASQGGMAPQGGSEQRMAPQENDIQEQRLLIIPNPVADCTTLEYYVPKGGKVSLQVSTSDGKPLAMLREEIAETGAYRYSWNTTNLAAGTYFCTFMLDGAVVVKRAVKVK